MPVRQSCSRLNSPWHGADVFDGIMITLAMSAMAIFHPGRLLKPVEKNEDTVVVETVMAEKPLSKTSSDAENSTEMTSAV